MKIDLNEKTISRHILIGLLGYFSAGCVKSEQKQSALPSQPNIVFIIADDMSWNDCGAYGNKNIRTPNLDRLANQGMKFNQAFLTASSCSPSRASIITGKYPHRTDAEQLHWPIPSGNITFVEHLREAGYWTAQAGKWHMGDSIKNRFDVVHDAGTEGYQLSPTGEKAVESGDGSGCEMWVYTLRERPKDKPFFLWLAAFDPHRPYQDSIIAIPHSPDKVIVPPYLPDAAEVRKELAQYYDEIFRLDDYIGKVLEELDRQNVSENTLVLFISDNGMPFPRDKTALYDGGIKTPFIVKWPAVVKPGTECNSLVSAVDIAPAFLRIAGAKPLTDIDGKDFSPLLTDPELHIRDIAYAEANWHDYAEFSRSVRTTEFKYIRNFYNDLPDTPPADVVRSETYRIMKKLRDSGGLTEDQKSCFIVPRPEEQLYDIQNDPYELTNLAGNPEYNMALEKLRKQLNDIMVETNDRLPVERSKDEFDRETGEPNQFRIRPRPSKSEMMRVGY